MFVSSLIKRILQYLLRKFPIFLEAGYVCQVSVVCVIVINPVHWYKENLPLDRENTGNI